jgi:recombinational DNA repair ATPase RecF
MKIQSVEWKNFNSYGNIVQRIDFEADRGDLYLLLGGNGHGKSTISEVITFALYGKIERKNKTDLPNRINKNLWCRIVIRSKNKIVEIKIHVPGDDFMVKKQCKTFEEGVELSSESLERLLLKRKEKIRVLFKL